MAYKDIVRQIYNFRNSKEYKALANYYSWPSLFRILGQSRKEDAHSRFIAWLLNPSGTHGLENLPLQKFLETIAYVRAVYPFAQKSSLDMECANAMLMGDYELLDVKVRTEKAYKNDTRGDKGRLDVFVTANIKRRGKVSPLCMVIENKVNSREHDKQTERYQAWINENRSKDAVTIAVYLTPLGKYDWERLSDPQCACKEFVQLNYQILADNIIVPCRDMAKSDKIKEYIDEYIRALWHPELDKDEKGDIIMAVAQEEQKLLMDFWDKHKELLLAAMHSMVNSGMLEDDGERNSVKKALETLQTISKKDYTKYTCLSPNGSTVTLNEKEELGKGPLVRAVIRDYAESHKDITYARLLEVFPNKLQGSFGVVIDEDGKKNKNYGTSHYHLEPIHLADKDIFVCTEWGAGNIKDFIKTAQDLEYKITAVSAD